MKRVVVAVLVLVMLCGAALASTKEQKIITYEKMQAGNYEGDSFRVIAKPVKGTIYGRTAWIWLVQNRQGDFQTVDGGHDWLVDEYELEKLSTDQQASIRAGEEFVLTINELAGRLYVKGFEKHVQPVRGSGEYDTDDRTSMIFCFVFIGGCVIAIIIGVVYSKAKKKRQIEYYGSEDKLAEAEREAEIIEWQQKERERQRRERARTIVKTRIIDFYSNSHTTGRTSATSAVGRGIVGGMIAGPLGAAVGASTAKKKYTTNEQRVVIFKVWYADGHDEIKRVSQGSSDYNKFIEKIED